LKPILSDLIAVGLVSSRDASTDELRRDRRTKWFLEITGEGRRFIRDLEALDKQCGGLLLGE